MKCIEKEEELQRIKECVHSSLIWEWIPSLSLHSLEFLFSPFLFLLINLTMVRRVQNSTEINNMAALNVARLGNGVLLNKPYISNDTILHSMDAILTEERWGTKIKKRKTIFNWRYRKRAKEIAEMVHFHPEKPERTFIETIEFAAKFDVRKMMNSSIKREYCWECWLDNSSSFVGSSLVSICWIWYHLLSYYRIHCISLCNNFHIFLLYVLEKTEVWMRKLCIHLNHLLMINVFPEHCIWSGS